MADIMETNKTVLTLWRPPRMNRLPLNLPLSLFVGEPPLLWLLKRCSRRKRIHPVASRIHREWRGHRSSRLNLQYRVIYKIERDEIYVQVEKVTPHDYVRN